MRKYFPIYEEAVSHIWLCSCSILNFLIREENLIFFFISVHTRLFRLINTQKGCCTATPPIAVVAQLHSVGCLSLRLHKMYLAFQPQSIYICRVQSSVLRLPKYWPPTPRPSECVLPPYQRLGGTHSPGREGVVWVNILEDARHWIGLLQFNPSTVSTDSEIHSYTESTGLLLQDVNNLISSSKEQRNF